jgi:hypothetical protein
MIVTRYRWIFIALYYAGVAILVLRDLLMVVPAAAPQSRRLNGSGNGDEGTDENMMTVAGSPVGMLEAFPLSPPLDTLPTTDPIANNSKRVDEDDEENRGFFSIQDTIMTRPDGALQADYVVGISSFHDTMRTFEGISHAEVKNATGLSLTPPDPCIAVGGKSSDQVVMMVNVAMQVYSKTTGRGLLDAPIPLSQIWTGIDKCDTSDGDPVVLYDQHHDRWLLLQFAVKDSTPYYLCFAVSETNDATGAFYRFRHDTGTLFPDFPKAGIWRDKLVVTTVTSMQSVSVYALNWHQMMQGMEPQVVAFTLLRRDYDAKIGWGLLPADVDGNHQPEANAAIPLIGTQDDDHSRFGATMDGLSIWELRVDWNTPTDATLQFVTTLPTLPLDTVFTCAPSSMDCLEQKNTTQKLDQDPILQRPLYRLAYQRFMIGNSTGETNNNTSPTPDTEPEPGPSSDSWWWCRIWPRSRFCRRREVEINAAVVTRAAETTNETVHGGEYESLLTNVIVQARPGIAGPRWFEIRRDPSTGTYQLYQEGTFSPDDGVHRFFASMAQDKFGNMALGYSVVGGNVYAGIRVTGRSAAAPVLGEMDLGEDIVVNGGGSQTGSNRWVRVRWRVTCATTTVEMEQ